MAGLSSLVNARRVSTTLEFVGKQILSGVLMWFYEWSYSTDGGGLGKGKEGACKEGAGPPRPGPREVGVT